MPNRILPEFWLYDPLICGLHKNAQLFLFRLGIGVDDDHRLFVGPSALHPLFLHSTLYPCNPEVRVTDVARCLQDCQAAGAVVVCDSERGWYVEIVERLRYRREDYREGQPKYGPRRAVPARQEQLPLGPVGLLRDREKTPRQRGRPRDGGAPAQVNRKRVEDESESESPRARRVVADVIDPPLTEAETRVLSHVDSPVRFARDAESLDDDGWRDLCRVLPPHELRCSGAAWLQRFQGRRRELVEIVGDYLAKTPEQRAQIENVAAWVTEGLENSSERRAG